MTWVTNPYRFGLQLQPARYWRWHPLVSLSAIGARDTLTAKLRLALTPGGTDVAEGMSATSSTGSGASSAFDANGASFWGCPYLDLSSRWIEVDLTTAQLPAEVGVQAHSTQPNLTPNVWLLLSGDTSPATNPVMIFELPWFASGQMQTTAIVQQSFADVEANARGWRVSVNAVQGGGSEARAAEIEFAPTLGGATLGAQDVYAFMREQNLGIGSPGRPLYAFNKNTGDYSQTYPLMPNYFGFIRQTPVGVMEEMLFTPNVNTATRPSDITVDWSVDGRTWHVKKSFPSVTGFTTGVPLSFDLR